MYDDRKWIPAQIYIIDNTEQGLTAGYDRECHFLFAAGFPENSMRRFISSGTRSQHFIHTVLIVILYRSQRKVKL